MSRPLHQFNRKEFLETGMSKNSLGYLLMQTDGGICVIYQGAEIGVAASLAEAEEMVKEHSQKPGIRLDCTIQR